MSRRQNSVLHVFFTKNTTDSVKGYVELVVICIPVMGESMFLNDCA